MTSIENAQDKRTFGSVESWVAKMRPTLMEIASINAQVRMLGLNSRLEARRAGVAGQAFGVVAEELGKLSHRTAAYAGQLTEDIDTFLTDMRAATLGATGAHLTELAVNTINLVDRTLHERSWDVRWWARESALFQACARPEDSALAERASVCLSALARTYPVYRDLVLVDATGRVLASARATSTATVGRSVSRTPWFTSAMSLGDASELAMQDVSIDPLFEIAAPIYSAAVRPGGQEREGAIGVLATVFDWPKQVGRMLQAMHVEENGQARCVIFNRRGVVIASSDDMGVLTESLAHLEGVRRALDGGTGFTRETGGSLIAYAHSAGYEAYRGLGWGCALVRRS